jgi:DNA-binding MarR family transcriptional regulator
MAKEGYYSVESLEPGNSVGYLVKRCGVLMTQVAERRFEAQAVSFTQWIALMTLLRQEHMSATQLSAECAHDMGALTRVVDELERRGLVRRERSRRDRRAVEIAITPAGRRVAQSTKKVIVGLLNELVAPFSDAEITTLIGLLQRMHSHLQEAAGRDSATAGKAAARVRGKASTGATP